MTDAHAGGAPPRLSTRDLSTGYRDHAVSDGLTLEIPDGSFTVIVGPNACGKSTLLRTLARLLPPRAGAVLLDGEEIAHVRTKELARTIGLLPQSSIAPEGITVGDLVSRGRHPHQTAFRRWSEEDEAAVREAIELTSLEELTTSVVDELSGGQRQRVWIAMALAQRTPLLLLDEPTTFLDLSHQLDVLDLCTDLQRTGRTLVAVLHDLNQAARYATHLIAMRDGSVVAQGAPSDVVTEELVASVFRVDARVVQDPESGSPLVIPRVRHTIRDSSPAQTPREREDHHE